MTEWIRTQDPYICCLQETHFRHRHIQTERKRMEKDIPCKWKLKARLAILISDEIDFKEYYKSPRGTLHNDQGISPRRRRNNCKYLCTQHWSTLIHKANTDRRKKGN